MLKMIAPVKDKSRFDHFVINSLKIKFTILCPLSYKSNSMYTVHSFVYIFDKPHVSLHFLQINLCVFQSFWIMHSDVCMFT